MAIVRKPRPGKTLILSLMPRRSEWAESLFVCSVVIYSPSQPRSSRGWTAYCQSLITGSLVRDVRNQNGIATISYYLRKSGLCQETFETETSRHISPVLILDEFKEDHLLRTAAGATAI
jgi:hypothetical protein